MSSPPESPSEPAPPEPAPPERVPPEPAPLEPAPPERVPPEPAPPQPEPALPRPVPPQVVVYEPLPRRRRPRWPIGVGILLVILVAGAVAADFAVRGYARGVVEGKVRTALSLPASAPIDVTVGGFSMLAQLVVGRLESVAVSSDSVTVGQLTGSAAVTALGVPLDETAPVRELSAVVSVGESELQKLSTSLSGLPSTSVAIVGTEIRVEASLDVVGIPIPLRIGLSPSVLGGQLAFTPTNVAINDATVSVDELRTLFGAGADSALQTRAVCVAQFLPSTFALQGADLRGRELVLTLRATDAVLTADALSVKGSCPPG